MAEGEKSRQNAIVARNKTIKEQQPQKRKRLRRAKGRIQLVVWSEDPIASSARGFSGASTLAMDDPDGVVVRALLPVLLLGRGGRRRRLRGPPGRQYRPGRILSG